MYNQQVKTNENFEEIKKARYAELLAELGDDIDFGMNIWICNKRIRNNSETPSNYSIYFNAIPENFKEIVKYYVIVRMMNGNSIRAVKNNIYGLVVFFKFWLKEYETSDILEVTSYTATLFKEFLDNTNYAEVTKNGIWSSISNLFIVMADFKQQRLHNYFSINPYLSHEKHDYKYIPELVADQLDKVFRDEKIALEIRCIYWILRFIPSRISEVLGMKIDCLKKYLSDYVIFIPTWKQNGGNKEPILRSIHIKDQDEGKFLIDMIKEQQELALNLQIKISDEEKGFLFTYQRKIIRKDDSVCLTKDFRIMRWSGLCYQLKRICEEYNIRDENGAIYSFTTHQLRHNGITDRLLSGFTIEQIAEMTAHHGDAMIYDSYAHFDLLPKEIVKKQKYVLREKDNEDISYVLFGGRILNMEEQLEKRLLKNIRAYKVRGGICSDITNCKSDMWNCLDCISFIPDYEQIAYFEEQAEVWRIKAERLGGFPVIRDNALKNAGLFQGVVDKIRLECNKGE